MPVAQVSQSNLSDASSFSPDTNISPSKHIINAISSSSTQHSPRSMPQNTDEIDSMKPSLSSSELISIPHSGSPSTSLNADNVIYKSPTLPAVPIGPKQLGPNKSKKKQTEEFRLQYRTAQRNEQDQIVSNSILTAAAAAVASTKRKTNSSSSSHNRSSTNMAHPGITNPLSHSGSSNSSKTTSKPTSPQPPLQTQTPAAKPGYSKSTVVTASNNNNKTTSNVQPRKETVKPPTTEKSVANLPSEAKDPNASIKRIIEKASAAVSKSHPVGALKQEQKTDHATSHTNSEFEDLEHRKTQTSPSHTTPTVKVAKNNNTNNNNNNQTSSDVNEPINTYHHLKAAQLAAKKLQSDTKPSSSDGNAVKQASSKLGVSVNTKASNTKSPVSTTADNEESINRSKNTALKAASLAAQKLKQQQQEQQQLQTASNESHTHIEPTLNVPVQFSSRTRSKSPAKYFQATIPIVRPETPPTNTSNSNTTKIYSPTPIKSSALHSIPLLQHHGSPSDIDRSSYILQGHESEESTSHAPAKIVAKPTYSMAVPTLRTHNHNHNHNHNRSSVSPILPTVGNPLDHLLKHHTGRVTSSSPSYDAGSISEPENNTNLSMDTNKNVLNNTNNSNNLDIPHGINELGLPTLHSQDLNKRPLSFHSQTHHSAMNNHPQTTQHVGFKNTTLRKHRKVKSNILSYESERGSNDFTQAAKLAAGTRQGSTSPTTPSSLLAPYTISHSNTLPVSSSASYASSMAIDPHSTVPYHRHHREHKGGILKRVKRKLISGSDKSQDDLIQAPVMIKTTMRKNSKRKTFNEDKPWKYHDARLPTEAEKKRYEGLWAANRGVHLKYMMPKDENSDSDSAFNNVIDSELLLQNNAILTKDEDGNIIAEYETDISMSSGDSESEDDTGEEDSDLDDVEEDSEDEFMSDTDDDPDATHYDIAVTHEETANNQQLQPGVANLNHNSSLLKSPTPDRISHYNQVSSPLQLSQTSSPSMSPFQSPLHHPDHASLSSSPVTVPSRQYLERRRSSPTFLLSQPDLLSANNTIIRRSSEFSHHGSKIARKLSPPVLNRHHSAAFDVPFSLSHPTPSKGIKLFRNSPPPRSRSPLTCQQYNPYQQLYPPSVGINNSAGQTTDNKENNTINTDTNNTTTPPISNDTTTTTARKNESLEKDIIVKKATTPVEDKQTTEKPRNIVRKPVNINNNSETAASKTTAIKSTNLDSKSNKEDLNNDNNDTSRRSSSSTTTNNNDKDLPKFLHTKYYRLYRDPKEDIHGYIVRELWRRSRLGDEILARIWDLVDRNYDCTLDREGFLVGMWLVDQCLYGRKLPTQIDYEVWKSVSRLNVTVDIRLGKKKKRENKEREKRIRKDIKKQAKIARHETLKQEKRKKKEEKKQKHSQHVQKC